MSHRSRRKTLSHADLEDFLCDLGEESNNDNLDSLSSLPSKSAQLFKTEDSPEDASVLESISDEQRVREFCKLQTRDENLNNVLAFEYGRVLMANTFYRILPMRKLYPESFEHPIESLEAKKCLLLSLKPMISDAETQRQFDSNQSKDFTRCVVGKSKSKTAAFEYTDIDTETVITPEEYEKRYLLHLRMLRVESDAPSAASIKKEVTPLNMNQNHDLIFKACTGAENIPANFMTSECVNGSTKSSSDVEKIKLNKKDCEKEMEKNENNDTRKSLSISPVLNGRRNARNSILFPVLREAGSPILSPLGNVKGRGSTSRRMTLSPATARSLILEVMEEEKEKEGEIAKGERVKGEKDVIIDDVKEDVKEKKDDVLIRDLSVTGTTSPHTHLPLLLSSPLPFSLTTLTSSSPLVMPLYPPLNSPPANFPLVIMNSKSEIEKITFEERNSTPSKKKIEKTKSGKMSNGTAILNFRIHTDQIEKTIIMNEEKERKISLSGNNKSFHHVQENKSSTTSETIAHTIIGTEKTTYNSSACTVTNTVEQLLVEGRFLRDEECSVESNSEENDSRKMELLNEVINSNSDEHEKDDKNEKEKSQDSVSEEMNVEELIVVTEFKEMKNLAYHEELNALLDSDSDVSTTVSPVRPAYPATANPVDSFSGISPEDLELTNELNSSPIMVISTDTEISRMVIPLQSTTSPGMFHEMTYSSESTEDSLHAFISLSKKLNNENENEDEIENDVVTDELVGNTLLLNNSLIADNQSSPIMNEAKNIDNDDDNDNDDCKIEEMLVMSPTIIAEVISDSNIQMDIPTEEIMITNDTAVLVRKRTEEYSERNEIMKKSKMEKLKTSRRCISLTTTESVKNVPWECSTERSLCSTNLTCFSPKKSESDFVVMDTQYTYRSELDDVTATTAATTTISNTVDFDIERQKNTMDTSNNTHITSNNSNFNTHTHTHNNTNEVVVEVALEVVLEVTLDSAKDRAMGRMSIRNEIAKWKYGWEVASFCAAQAARQKLGLLSRF